MAESITITNDILNGNSWDMLCALTGMTGSMDSPEDVERILGSVYIGGKNLADTYDHELTSEDVSDFAGWVRTALDPQNNEIVTIMNRNSLVPNPRAVLIDTEGMEEEERTAYEQKNAASSDYANNYVQKMRQAVEDAKNWFKDIPLHDIYIKSYEETANILIPNLMVDSTRNNKFQRMPEAFPILYMLSKGYSMEDAFITDQNEPGIKEMREKERDEFYDLFSLAKDSDGNYIKDRNDPANIKKFNEVVYPALEKMLKSIMEFKYDYIDISEPDSVKKMYAHARMGHWLQEFIQQVPNDYGKGIACAAVGISNNVADLYRNVTSYIESDLYTGGAPIENANDQDKIKTNAIVYNYELAKHIGGYKGFTEMPISAIPATEASRLFAPILGVYAQNFEIDVAEYDEFRKDPQKNVMGTFTKFCEEISHYPVPDVDAIEECINTARNNVETKTSDELFEEIAVRDATAPLISSSSGIREREQLICDPSDPQSVYKFLSTTTGIIINEKTPESYLDAAIDKFMINGVSAREFFKADKTDVMENAKIVASGLSVLMQGIYVGGPYLGNEEMNRQYNKMTDNGKKTLFVFCKNVDGMVQPCRITPTYSKLDEESKNIPLEQVSSRLLTEDEVREYINNSLADAYENLKINDGGKTAADYKDLEPVHMVTFNFSNTPNQLLYGYLDSYNEYREKFRNNIKLAKDQTQYERMMDEERAILRAEGKDGLSVRQVEESLIRRQILSENPSIVDGKEELDRRLNSVLKAQGKPSVKEIEEGIDERVDAILKGNLEKYNTYIIQKGSSTFRDKEEDRGRAYGNAADAYANILNNEPLSDRNKRNMQGFDIKEFPKIGYDDIRNGKTFMDFVDRNKDVLSVSNICINGKSLSEYFGTKNLDEHQAGIVAEMLRNMTDVKKLAEAVAHTEEGKNSIGTKDMPFVSIGNGAGRMIPFTFGKEKLPEVLPEVKPMSNFKKLIFKDAARENARAIEEYEQSIKDVYAAVNRNDTVDRINNVAGVYAKLFNRQELSPEERSTAHKYKLSLPGIDRNVEAAVRFVSADSLSRSRANTNDAPALTRPVASHDQPAMNGPQQGMSH